MILVYAIILFLATLAGGSIPLWRKNWNPSHLQYLLAFSGAFLLGITLLHLIPETITHGDNNVPILILSGFFLQLFFQRITHGMEHGHVHLDNNHQHGSKIHLSLLLGLGVHAFSEGLPLGIPYHDESIVPTLFAAIGVHKLPEAMLIASVIFISTHHNKTKTFIYLALFAAITPISALITYMLDNNVAQLQPIINWCIPIIAGSFLHISTTILYESGTQKHKMKAKKWMIVLLGVLLAYITTMFTSHQH